MARPSPAVPLWILMGAAQLLDLMWAALAGLAYRALRRQDGLTAALIVGAAVFSHWPLDFLAHRPDLSLFDNTAKVGLGLWNYPSLESAVEFSFLWGGMYLYWKAARPSAVRLLVLALALMGLHAFATYGPLPSSAAAAAGTLLAAYAAAAALAWWADPRPSPAPELI